MKNHIRSKFLTPGSRNWLQLWTPKLYQSTVYLADLNKFIFGSLETSLCCLLYTKSAHMPHTHAFSVLPIITCSFCYVDPSSSTHAISVLPVITCSFCYVDPSSSRTTTWSRRHSLVSPYVCSPCVCCIAGFAA